MRWNHLPLEPALELAGRVSVDRATRLEVVAGPKALAIRIGESPRNVYRWVQDGVAWDQAERIAWGLGYHVYEIWGVQADWVMPFVELERVGYFGGRPECWRAQPYRLRDRGLAA